MRAEGNIRHERRDGNGGKTDARERDLIPIGPVFVAANGFPYDRRQWQPSPDTEEVRQHLLALVRAVSEQPTEEYPAGVDTDEMVVWHLGEFREGRAAEERRRIAAFSPDVSSGRFGRTLESLVAVAKEAIAKLGVGTA